MEKCIHILLRDKLSGAEKMALILCENLNRYEPIVICGGDNLKKVFENKGIESYSLEFSAKKIVTYIKKIKKIIEKNNVTIIHGHDNYASIVAYLVKRIYGLNIKVISHIHSCYPFLESGGVAKKVDSIVRPKYDFNIICGKDVEEYYFKYSNYIDKDRCTVLSNAIDLVSIANYSSLVNVENLKKELNIDNKNKVIGFVGRICDIKGIVPFIKALGTNKEKFDDSVILLIGSGEQEEEVKNLINELDLNDIVIMLGYQTDVYKYYPLMDIFILPSKYEGLPMVILEAMAFKKAVVAMNVGGIGEVITDKANGILISKDNYNEFVSRLALLKNDNDLILEVSENAYMNIKDNYDIEVYDKKLEKIYDMVVSRKE